MPHPAQPGPVHARSDGGETTHDRFTPTGVHCVRCAYDLVGLPESGLCPECGTPVEHSLRGHLLTYAAPTYVRAIAQGLSLVLTGFAALGLFVVLYVWLSGGGSTKQNSATLAAGLDVLYAAAVLLILLGYLRYSTPDPGYSGREEPVTARRVLRWSSSVMLSLALGAVVMRAYGLPTGLRTLGSIAVVDDPAFPGGLVMAGILASMCVQYFAVLRYTAWLGLRVPDGFIVAKARRYRWVLPLMPLWGLAPVAASLAAGQAGALGWIICCAFCTLPLAVFIAVLLFVSLLWRMQSHARSILRTGKPEFYLEMPPSSDMQWSAPRSSNRTW